MAVMLGEDIVEEEVVWGRMSSALPSGEGREMRSAVMR